MFQVQDRAELTPTSRTPVPQPPGPSRTNTATARPSNTRAPAPSTPGRKKNKVKPSPGPFRRRLSDSSSSASVSRQSSPERQVRQSINLPHADSVSTEPPTPSSTSEEVDQPVAGPSEPQGYAVESPRRSKGRGRHKYHALEVEDGPTVRQASKGLSGRNKALWKWVNVVDLDKFLQDVYWYYKGKGLQCIIIARSLTLL